MFNALWNNLLSSAGILHFSTITAYVGQILALLEEEYVKDGNARDAAIDALIEILQQHKTKP